MSNEQIDRIRLWLWNQTSADPERARTYRTTAESLPEPEDEAVERYRTLVRFWELVREVRDESENGSQSRSEADAYEPMMRFAERRFASHNTRTMAWSGIGNFQADLREAVRHARSIAIETVVDRLEILWPDSRDSRIDPDGEDLTDKMGVIYDPVSKLQSPISAQAAGDDATGEKDMDRAMTIANQAKRDLAEEIVDDGVPAPE